MLLDLKLFRSICLAVVPLILFSCQSPLGQDEKEQLTPDWEKIGPGGGGSTFIPTFSYATPATFLVRCDMTGSYLTKDGGQSYRQLNFTNGTSGFAFDPTDANTMYIGSVGLHQSTDGGQTWLPLFPKPSEVKATRYEGDHAELRLETTPGSLYPDQEDSRSITSIRVDPTQPERLYFGMDLWFFYTFDRPSTGKFISATLGCVCTSRL